MAGDKLTIGALRGGGGRRLYLVLALLVLCDVWAFEALRAEVGPDLTSSPTGE